MDKKKMLKKMLNVSQIGLGMLIGTILLIVWGLISLCMHLLDESSSQELTKEGEVLIQHNYEKEKGDRK